MPRDRRRAVGRPGIGRGPRRELIERDTPPRRHHRAARRAGRPRPLGEELRARRASTTSTSATSSRRSPAAGCCPPTPVRSSPAPRAIRCTRSSSRPASPGRRRARHRAADRRAHRRAHRDRARAPSAARPCSAADPARALRELRRHAAHRGRARRRSSSSDADGVTFRSELFRDVAYEQLTFQARRELHRAAAATLEADPALGGLGAPSCSRRTTRPRATGRPRGGRPSSAAEAAHSAFALEEAVRSYRARGRAARHAGRAAPRISPALLEALGRVSRRRRLGEGRARGLLAAPASSSPTPSPARGSTASARTRSTSSAGRTRRCARCARRAAP